MLLTLFTRSLMSRLAPFANGEASLTMFDLPEYAIRHLGLHGLNLPASMLAGWSLDDFDRLRDKADKAGCPCLVLVDDTPLRFRVDDLEALEAAADRLRRLAFAGHRLSCNAIGFSCDAPDSDESLEEVADQIKDVLPEIERMELNLLIAPHTGLTFDPDRLTDLIKRIGGFRIGSLPSFGHAAATGDVIGTLRKLAPYAGVVHATIDSFTKSGKHQGYDLAECVTAIRNVGFVNTLAIDYTGKDDPLDVVELARSQLQAAIDAEG